MADLEFWYSEVNDNSVIEIGSGDESTIMDGTVDVRVSQAIADNLGLSGETHVWDAQISIAWRRWSVPKVMVAVPEELNRRGLDIFKLGDVEIDLGPFGIIDTSRHPGARDHRWRQLEVELNELKSEHVTPVSLLKFHVVNGPRLCDAGPGLQEALVTDIAGMRLRLWQAPVVESLEETPHNSRISAITAVGEITTRDGTLFEPMSQGVEQLIDAVNSTLSLMVGSRVQCNSFMGFDNDGELVWQRHIRGRVPEPGGQDLIRRKHKWFLNGRRSAAVASIFRAWYTHRENAHLSAVLDWYIRGCDTHDPRMAVVALQIPLEGAAWHYLSSEQMLSEESVRKLATGELIHLFLSLRGADTRWRDDAPDWQVKYGKANSTKVNRHVPELLVRVRNDLVHGVVKDSGGLETDKVEELRVLSEHYVEYALLSGLDALPS